MSPAPTKDDLAREAWRLISELVFDQDRRRMVSDATGLSFAKTRALRRLLDGPHSMGELSTLLGMDRPNATALVADLEISGHVCRGRDESDGRVVTVSLTDRGRASAHEARDILNAPPPRLRRMSKHELLELVRLLDDGGDQ